MKKALVIIVSVFIVLSVARFSFAEEKKHSKKAMLVSGEVTAVDAAANTLTIKGKKGEVVLTTTDKTKFDEGKTLADVKVGDKLSAECSAKDGKMMAWKVMTKKEMEKQQKEKGVKMEIEEKKQKKERNNFLSYFPKGEIKYLLFPFIWSRGSERDHSDYFCPEDEVLSGAAG